MNNNQIFIQRIKKIMADNIRETPSFMDSSCFILEEDFDPYTGEGIIVLPFSSESSLAIATIKHMMRISEKLSGILLTMVVPLNSTPADAFLSNSFYLNVDSLDQAISKGADKAIVTISIFYLTGDHELSVMPFKMDEGEASFGEEVVITDSEVVISLKDSLFEIQYNA